MQPGTVLLSLVPAYEPLLTEVAIENRDIGFVQGSSMSVKTTLVVSMATITVLWGCTGDGIVEREWYEDVLLDDGSTIVVKRSVSFKESNSWSGDAYNAIEQSATISFTGSMASLPTWGAPLIALLLYRDKISDQWVIVAATSSCDVWNDRGFPPSRYWEYRLVGGSWQEVPLTSGSKGRAVNLLHRYQDRLPSEHITIADRLKLESDVRIAKKYRSIDVKEASRNCQLTFENKRKAQQ